MSLHKHRLLRERDGYLPLSGSVVESNPSPTASILAQNTATLTNPPPPSGIPLVASSVFDNLSTSAAQSSTPTPTATVSSSTSSGNQISLGTVIGACVAALIALLFSLLLAFYCSKRYQKSTAYAKSRNAVNNLSRSRLHLEPWKRIDDGGDPREGQERSMKQRPLSGPLGAMFHRTISNTSGEKSSEGHNRESVGTMQNFAKYHPGLAAEMASQNAIKGVDGQVAKPAPVLRLMGRGLAMTPPISVDGETVGGDSFFSLHSSLSSSMSPNMMAERSTPPAIASSSHRWESAEVLHVSRFGPDFSDAGELQNPFSDKASSVKSSLKGQNPFFSAREHHVRRTLLPDTTHDNPFADTNAPRDSDDAIQSLIAALAVPKGQDNDRIVSVQSSVYSRVTADDGDSSISVTAFPYPPTQIKLC